ncbi:major capsid protein [Rhodococcus sp. NPDC060086]|uniref:major capsid protein n=1 Tax=Rhodococcus sp. NPDC060086 TaxID=3347055 RepID=UPI00365FA08C
MANANFLVPSLNEGGTKLTVEMALKMPTTIRQRIAEVVARRTIAGAFFSATGSKVEGGGILHSVLKAEDFYASDPVDRAPGSEYERIDTPEPTYDLAKLQDFGGYYEITDEERDRNMTDVIMERTDTVSNSILRSLDRRAIAAIDAAVAKIPAGGGIVPGVDVSAIELNGDPTTQTATSARFEATLSALNLSVEIDELGFELDTLVLHPSEKSQLALAYGKDLSELLDAFGFKIISSPLVTAGTGYAVATGQAGRIGYEKALTVESIPQRERRTTRVQAYIVPAFAVTNPYAVKKITGMAG